MKVMGAHFGVSFAGMALLFCALSFGAPPLDSHSNTRPSAAAAVLSDRNPLVSPRPSPPGLIKLDPSDQISTPPVQQTDGPQDVVVRSPPALIPALGVLVLLVIWRLYPGSRARRMAFNSNRRAR
ncbi:MAG TPA: hypothetical protein VFW23_18370 [Tepidisphaeraceae bacterium]|nr:hypothetical protein [Tepidisphaeraceae bacterium]